MSQKHKRTVEISYPFGFNSSEKELLNLELFKHNIINLDNWDTEIPSFESTTVESTEKKYTVVMYNGELVFNYRSDAQAVIDQLVAQGIGVNEEPNVTEEVSETVIEPQWRGSTILYLDAPYHLGSYSQKFHIVSENDVGEANVKLFVDFTAYSYTSKLTFTAEWTTERVQKADVIEQHLVDLPTPLMGKIQSIFEGIFYSEMFDKSTEEPIISCNFDVVSKHSSECKPSVIEMLREARDRASSEEE
tara:strand:+ start:419 stop:1159 length:741 start_codon:yes stop_codon:yes gene_type:complete